MLWSLQPPINPHGHRPDPHRPPPMQPGTPLPPGPEIGMLTREALLGVSRERRFAAAAC